MRMMRARLLAAMSLGSLAACPRTQEPTVASGGNTPGDVSAASTSTAVSVASGDPPVDAGVAIVDAAPPAETASVAPEAAVDVGPADVKPDAKPDAEAIQQAIARSTPPPPSRDCANAAHGVLGSEAESVLIGTAYDEVVRPCVVALINEAPRAEKQATEPVSPCATPC